MLSYANVCINLFFEYFVLIFLLITSKMYFYVILYDLVVDNFLYFLICPHPLLLLPFQEVKQVNSVKVQFDHFVAKQQVCVRV